MSDEPFTVEWLVEIGFVEIRRNEIETIIGLWGKSENDWRIVYSSIIGWEIFGQYCPVPIISRSDVLKWLDVLKLKNCTLD
jgi:hypothetical protein